MSDTNSNTVDESLNTVNQTMNTTTQSAPTSSNESLQVGDLQLLVNAIHIAQRKGAYSLEESSALFNIIKKVRATISSQNS